MWIIYVGIAALTYAISNGFNDNSVGSAILTLFLLGALASAIYYVVYPLTPYGTMMDSVKKEVDKEYIEHKNSLFSKNSRNILTYSFVFVLFVLSRRIVAFSKYIKDYGFDNNGAHISIIVLLSGLGVFLVFMRKYKTMARSEKRELEFMDAETEIAFSDKIEAYLEHRRNNPQYKNITYTGGYHETVRTNVMGTLMIKEDLLCMHSSYHDEIIFEIPVSDIKGFKYEQIEDDSYNSSIYSQVNLMYIYYVSDNKKNMLRFKLDGKVKHHLENRVNEINRDNETTQNNNTFNEAFEKTDDQKSSVEIQNVINKKYESIENRLERLKYFMDKGLITEQEYTKRKQEIIDEV